MTKITRHISRLTIILAGTLLFTACGVRDISITSATFKMDEDKNKIIDICFDKSVLKKDNLFLVFNFDTKTKKTFRHEHTLYGADKNCYSLYAYSIFTQKFTSKEDKNFLDNHLNTGNIKSMTIQVYNKYGGKLLFNGTFKDL